MQSKNKFRRVFALFLAAMMLMSMSVSAFADNVVGSGTVTGGDLTMSASDAPSFSAVTLDGANKTQTDSIDISVNDARGSGAGWALSITSTTFATAGGKTLPNTALAITGVTSACDQGTCTAPTNGVGYNLTVPADTVAPTAVEFFEAAVDTGMGDFTITPAFQLSIPANTYAGAYSSTVTITHTAAP